MIIDRSGKNVFASHCVLAMQAMADAVENSEFVILCMSDSYKRSVYCQAEAEYAFQCKRHLLPVIVRQGYRADGWLGLIIGSRIYVDYGRLEFSQACKLLLKEIVLQRENQSSAKPLNPSPPMTQAVSSVDDGLPSDYTSRDTSKSLYRMTSLETWSRSEVLDFLFDRNLQLMMPLCELLTGHGLLKLFRISQRKPNRFFRQLNDELSTRFHGLHLPIGIFTQYLSEMDRLISPLLTSPVIQAIEQDAIEPKSTPPSPPPSIIVTNLPSSSTPLVPFSSQHSRQPVVSPTVTTVERSCNVQITEQAAYRTW